MLVDQEAKNMDFIILSFIGVRRGFLQCMWWCTVIYSPTNSWEAPPAKL